MINITFNGVGYPVAQTGDSDWGGLTDYLVAVAAGALQKSGGNFTLTADVDFGASNGIKLTYLKSRSASIAAAGLIRLGVTDLISWRNNANSADLALSVNGTDQLLFNSSLLLTSTGSITANRALASNGSGSIISSSVTDTELGRLSGVGSAVKGISDAATLTNKTIDAASNTLSNIANSSISSSAAIAYSKLNLATSIVNSDVNASAAIARTKLAGLIVSTATTTYPVAASDDVVLCSGAAFTVTLPTAAGVSGKVYTIKKTDSSLTNIITIATTSAQTIDGVTTTTLNTQYEAVMVVSDGANWQVLERRIPSSAQTFTMTITGSVSNPTKGTVTLDRAVWSRIGNSIRITYQYIQSVGGTSGSGNYLFALPSGIAVDTSLLSVANFSFSNIGAFHASTNSDNFSASSADGHVFAYDSTHLGLQVFSTASPTQAIIGSGAYALGNSPLAYLFEATFPVSGWNG